MATGGRTTGADRLLAAWTVLVTILLLIPLDLLRGWAGLDRVQPPGGLDKTAHFVLFFVLAALAARSTRPRMRRPLLVAAVASLLYGALLEVAQGVSGVRVAELGDVVADGLGSFAGVLVPAFRRRS